ncbi:hypothetical protein IKN40_08585 [bacterium]|nr:hypothetical protein [bacterium]
MISQVHVAGKFFSLVYGLFGQVGVSQTALQESFSTSIEYSQSSEVCQISLSIRYQASLSQAIAFTFSSSQGQSTGDRSIHQLELSLRYLGTFGLYCLDQSSLKKSTTQSFSN